jgi:predicted alpha/beta superfamily hydrolase
VPSFVAAYPFQPSDRITLRCEPDWHADREPLEQTADQAVFEVPLPPDTNVVQLKVVLHRGGATHWSLGANYVLRASGPPRVGHPVFFHADGHLTARTSLQAPAIGGALTVRVFLPGGYDENTSRRYPVLYAMDGANLFDPAESFGGAEWEVDETVALLDRMAIIDKVMVVGVYARDGLREHDYTDPGYHALATALVDTVVPWVDSSFRTQPGRDHRAVLGSSLGGVFSLHAFWRHPEVFGSAAALSATFGYRDDLFRRVATEPMRRGKLYVDAGYPQDNFEAVRRMAHALADRGADLRYVAHPRGLHSELHWADRLHLPLQYLFGDARH